MAFPKCRSGLALALLVLLTSSGCSLRKIAINALADELSTGSSSVFTSDEDPELIRDAMPFALKTMETLLEQTPDHRGLLLSTCQSFALYGAGFVELDADKLELTSYREAKRQHERALKLSLRARGYCFRSLELAYPGITSEVIRDMKATSRIAAVEDVPLLYWTAGAWGSAIAGGLDQPELVADLPAVRALLARALELDEDWDRGALHDGMMLIELVDPSAPPGSLERARQHYERALELNDGQRATTYVGWASTQSIQAQDRKEFVRLLELALAVDPDRLPKERLANLVQQDRARWLLSQVDDLFLDDFEELDEDDGSDP